MFSSQSVGVKHWLDKGVVSERSGLHSSSVSHSSLSLSLLASGPESGTQRLDFTNLSALHPTLGPHCAVSKAVPVERTSPCKDEQYENDRNQHVQPPAFLITLARSSFQEIFLYLAAYR